MDYYVCIATMAKFNVENQRAAKNKSWQHYAYSLSQSQTLILREVCLYK